MDDINSADAIREAMDKYLEDRIADAIGDHEWVRLIDLDAHLRDYENRRIGKPLPVKDFIIHEEEDWLDL